MNLPREIREKKALKILHSSQIIHVRDSELYLVESEGDPDNYYQTSLNTCTCAYHTAYQEHCKHIIAVEFLKEKNITPIEMDIEQTGDYIQKYTQYKKDYKQEIIERNTKIVTRQISKQLRDEYDKKFEEIKSKLGERITRLKDEIEDLKTKKREIKLLNRKPSKVEVRMKKEGKPCNTKTLPYKSDQYGF